MIRIIFFIISLISVYAGCAPIESSSSSAGLYSGSVTIIEPLEQSYIDELTTVSAQPDGLDAARIRRMDFYCQEQLIGTDDTLPYSIRFDAKSLPEGTVSIKAVAVLDNNQNIFSIRTVQVARGVYVSMNGRVGAAGTRTDPFLNIQDGVNLAAQNGRKAVYISGGSYKPGYGLNANDHGVVICADDIRLVGGYNSDYSVRDQVTVLNGQNYLYHVIVITNSSGITVENISIKGGLADSADWLGQGGAVYLKNVSNLLLKDMNLYNNQAVYGGALYTAYAYDTVLTNIRMYQNAATTLGGGIYTYRVTNMHMIGVTISTNSSQNASGGVISESRNVLIDNALIVGNSNNVSFNVCILIDKVPDLTVSRSFMLNNKGWLEFQSFLTNVLIKDSCFSNNLEAVYIGFSGYYGLTISNNEFSGRVNDDNHLNNIMNHYALTTGTASGGLRLVDNHFITETFLWPLMHINTKYIYCNNNWTNMNSAGLYGWQEARGNRISRIYNIFYYSATQPASLNGGKFPALPKYMISDWEIINNHGVDEVRFAEGGFGNDLGNRFDLNNLTNITLSGGYNSDFTEKTGYTYLITRDMSGVTHAVSMTNCLNVRFYGFAVSNSYSNDTAVYFYNTRGSVFSNLLFTNLNQYLDYNGSSLIHVNQSYNNTFADIRLINNGNRVNGLVYVNNCQSNIFRGLFFQGNTSWDGQGAGIEFFISKNNVVDGLYAYNNGALYATYLKSIFEDVAGVSNSLINSVITNNHVNFSVEGALIWLESTGIGLVISNNVLGSVQPNRIVLVHEESAVNGQIFAYNRFLSVSNHIFYHNSTGSRISNANSSELNNAAFTGSLAAFSNSVVP